MKKLCFVTSARSEYGLLKWLMKEVDKSESFHLQLIATGGHLLHEQGHTVDQIREDGFTIDSEVDVKLDYSTKEKIASSMGRMAEGMAHAFSILKPDYLVVLGDRYELLPICNTALVMGVPIVHISGGDVTEGALDNCIRNAITMIATYHFPGTEESAANIRRMRGNDENIWVVGEPGLDSFNREELHGRATLVEMLGLDDSKQWVLMTYHAETNNTLEANMKAVKNCCNALADTNGIQVVMTYANADYGGSQINEYLEKTAKDNPEKFKCIPSLGSSRYLSLMRQASLVIGNSSSGIVEAPSLRIPAVNIGDRQKGRHLCSNVIQTGTSYQDIIGAIKRALNNEVDTTDVDCWGDGNTSSKIIHVMEKFL